ncbi:hypothetical protein CEV32_1713 [Brucella rhizosphaerae]|uniref:Uncharacterized protein n=1 Tax=Brucella rhizosphaerae TaxID=571254 RepID=A0A256F356_9HYPH|nr:hypothetical protein CEV32_1713 [Brucella rhizosphaerae]
MLPKNPLVANPAYHGPLFKVPLVLLIFLRTIFYTHPALYRFCDG